jgi:type III pantothenate kinase
MNILLIDIGNTRLKWLLARSGQPLPTAHAFVHGGDAAAAIAAFPLETSAQPDAVWVAHVLGREHEVAITAAVQQRFGGLPRFARSPAAQAGWRSAYAEPAWLGVDRFLAMLGLWSETRCGFCVASAGTALTFDAVDDGGQHLGGVIAPGLEAMIAATLGRTRFATEARPPQFDDGLAIDSTHAVHQGALHAAAGLLDRLGARHGGARKVLCGGDATTLQPLLHEGWQLRPDAVLQGLAVLAATESPD